MIKSLPNVIEGEQLSRKIVTKMYYKLINAFVEDVQFVDGVGDFRLLSQRAVCNC